MASQAPNNRLTKRCVFQSLALIAISPFLASCCKGSNAGNSLQGNALAKQCVQIIDTWASTHKDTQYEILSMEEAGVPFRRYAVSMTMQAALGELPGIASCDYKLATNGQQADKPFRVAIGRSVFTSERDIGDLLSLNKNFEAAEHNH